MIDICGGHVDVDACFYFTIQGEYFTILFSWVYIYIWKL